MSHLPRESGQALLLILLSMAVVLTVVLSIVARSVTDINITSQEESALRAFSAAEAGVEKALFVGSSIGGDFGDAKFDAQVTGSATAVSEFNFPAGLPAGESQTIWFVNHNDNGNLSCDGSHPCFTGSALKVCWGASGASSSSPTTPAIEVSVFYTTNPGDYSTTKVARVAYDPYSTRASAGVGGDSPNHFSAPDAGACTVSGKTYAFQRRLDFAGMGIPASAYGAQNGLQFAKVRMFYNTDADSELGVSTGGVGLLPPQGLNIASTGTAGDSSRKVVVFQGFGEAPSIFDSVLFSPSGITHN